MKSNNRGNIEINLGTFLDASGSHFGKVESSHILVKVTKRLIFSMLYISFIVSLFLLTRVEIRKNAVSNRFLLVFSLSSQQIDNGEESEGLLEFLAEERFELETKDSTVLIEEKNLRGIIRRDSRVVPSIWIAMLWKYSDKCEKRKFFRTSIQTFNSVFKLNVIYKSNPVIAAYALAEFSYWASAQKKKMQSVTSQSSMNKLPIPFILQDIMASLHMFWYSSNSTPIERLESRQHPYLLNSELSKKDICHHVWDESSKSFLNSQGIENIRLQGSILFVPRRKITVQIGAHAVVYFDVTPFKNGENYYSEDRMIANIRTICEIRRQLKIEENIHFPLFLKPKRKFLQAHSSGYVDRLSELEDLGEIVILNENLNLYGLLEKTIVALGVPFTSPIVLAKEMQVNAAYIDFGHQDYKLPEFHEGVELLRSSRALKSRLISLL